MSNSSADAHGGTSNGTRATTIATAAKAEAEARALQQLYNQRVPEYFAVTIVGLILIFSIFHWSRFMYNRHVSTRPNSSALEKIAAGMSRYVATSIIGLADTDLE